MTEISAVEQLKLISQETGEYTVNNRVIYFAEVIIDYFNRKGNYNISIFNNVGQQLIIKVNARYKSAILIIESDTIFSIKYILREKYTSNSDIEASIQIEEISKIKEWLDRYPTWIEDSRYKEHLERFELYLSFYRQTLSRKQVMKVFRELEYYYTGVHPLELWEAAWNIYEFTNS